MIQQPGNATEAWLVDIVARQARAAGIGMPEVAVYDSPDVNAFATGMNRNGKMIAALERLHALHEPGPLPEKLAAFGISGKAAAGLRRLFMTHPPLAERIAALRDA